MGEKKHTKKQDFSPLGGMQGGDYQQAAA